MLIDLCKVDSRTLGRYMGDGLESFYKYHGVSADK